MNELYPLQGRMICKEQRGTEEKKREKERERETININMKCYLSQAVSGKMLVETSFFGL